MRWVLFLILLLAFLSTTPTRAIEMNGGYDTTPPTSSDIPHWNTGWGNANVTGWNYVGIVDGKSTGTEYVCSGVYLGNGWVLTAGHVGYGNFTLGNTAYVPIAGSAQTILDPNGTADLCLFQIASPPTNLPSLIISTSAPVAFSFSKAGSKVAMLGNGGASGGGNPLSWGLNTVTEINEPMPVTSGVTTFNSHDFFTDHGTVIRGSSTATNNAQVVVGDSGGGDFIYNSTTQMWELSGINEINGAWNGTNGDPYYGDGTFTGMVQLSTYATQINPIVQTTYNPPCDTPAMPVPGLVAMSCMLFLAASRYLVATRA